MEGEVEEEEEVIHGVIEMEEVVVEAQPLFLENRQWILAKETSQVEQVMHPTVNAQNLVNVVVAVARLSVDGIAKKTEISQETETAIEIVVGTVAVKKREIEVSEIAVIETRIATAIVAATEEEIVIRDAQDRGRETEIVARGKEEKKIQVVAEAVNNAEEDGRVLSIDLVNLD
jgi:hypothetical protein